MPLQTPFGSTNVPELEIEGDSTTWNIRLTQRIVVPGMAEPIESWSLYNGDKLESSPFPKRDVQQWRDEELKKLK